MCSLHTFPPLTLHATNEIYAGIRISRGAVALSLHVYGHTKIYTLRGAHNTEHTTTSIINRQRDAAERMAQSGKTNINVCCVMRRVAPPIFHWLTYVRTALRLLLLLMMSAVRHREWGGESGVVGVICATTAHGVSLWVSVCSMAATADSTAHRHLVANMRLTNTVKLVRCGNNTDFYRTYIFKSMSGTSLLLQTDMIRYVIPNA